MTFDGWIHLIEVVMVVGIAGVIWVLKTREKKFGETTDNKSQP